MKEDEKVYTFREKKMENLVDFQRIGPLNLAKKKKKKKKNLYQMKLNLLRMKLTLHKNEPQFTPN